MPQDRSRKIFIYFFLFLLIGTLNNKNLINLNIIKLNKIKVIGLDEEDTVELNNNLDLLRLNNLLFIDKNKVIEIINSNNLIESYSVFKKYPSTIELRIDKTRFLAKIKKEDGDFYLGSNGKLIKALDNNISLPLIFGNFKIKNFFELKKAIDKSNFDYDKINNFYFFKSGRWDIETVSGLLIRLPRNDNQKFLDLAVKILEDDQNIINELDLRQHNQIIINGN